MGEERKKQEAEEREARRAKEAADEKAEAARKAEETKQKSNEEKKREAESKIGKEPKEDEFDGEFDAVRAKEEAKAKAPHGFFNGVQPNASKRSAIERHEPVKEAVELKEREEKRLKEKYEDEERGR